MDTRVYDFRDLISIDPVMWGQIDPIGLMTYHAYKRRQNYCEATDYWAALEKGLAATDLAILKHIKAVGKVSNSAKKALSHILDKAIKYDVSNSSGSYDGAPTAMAVKLFMRSMNEDVDMLGEALTPQQRMHRKMVMRRIAPKLARARAIAMKRRGGTDVLKRRARGLARTMMARKLLGGRNKADVSVGERARIEKILATRKKGIERLATRLVPTVRKKQSARFAHKQVRPGTVTKPKHTPATKPASSAKPHPSNKPAKHVPAPVPPKHIAAPPPTKNQYADKL
jgi:hypothetical protein